MTEANRLYRQLLDCARDALAERGFRRKGNTFWRRNRDSWAIVEFQRLRDSGPEAVFFTVKLGFAYDALPTVMEWDANGRVPPKTFDCHVSVSIEHVLPDRSPFGFYLWLVDENTDIKRLEQAFTGYLNGPVLDFVETLSTLDGLRRHWLRKGDRGSIQDRELAWLRLLDDTVDIDALASSPQRLHRRKRQEVRPIDFSQLPPMWIETRRA